MGVCLCVCVKDKPFSFFAERLYYCYKKNFKRNTRNIAEV